jgi:parvulin-like peptidyl-prolyl isomerase
MRTELDYAAAQRSLEPDDRRLADALTIMWRMGQITQAGGSLELARRASLNPTDPDTIPMDFDERTADRQRTELIRIYNQKKVIPRIQVAANDIREYYDRNVNLKFTQTERVTFRLIKVDIAKTGGAGPDARGKAINKVADLSRRAKGGEDFAVMAKRENDEKMFAGDEPFDVAPGSFAITKVADALKKLNPGEVSDPIEDKDGFYIVKVESKQGGRTRPFEEQKVQDEIRNLLRQEQYAKLREQDFARLMNSAAIETSQEMQNIAIDMAMQRYAEYAGK